MSFSTALAVFMEQQIKSAVGERRRLLKKERHAETLFLQKVWWLLGLGFAKLQAEYEFRDFKGKVRFADFMFLGLYYRIIIEIDGFDTHVTKMDRDMLIDDRERQNGLSFHGFVIVRFSYDQILNKPMDCVHFLKTFIAKLDNQTAWMFGMSVRERMIVHFAIQCGERHFTLSEVRSAIGLGEKTVRQLLKGLVERKVLIAEGEAIRTRYYRLAHNILPELYEN